jgi:hypothetical protein
MFGFTCKMKLLQTQTVTRTGVILIAQTQSNYDHRLNILDTYVLNT